MSIFNKVRFAEPPKPARAARVLPRILRWDSGRYRVEQSHQGR